MSGFFTLMVRQAENGWVWMYTAGMPEDSRAARAAELESDAWEHERLAEARQDRFSIQFVHRVVRGMPADLRWRLEHGRAGFDRQRWLEVLVAVLLTAGVVVGLPASGLLMQQSGISHQGRPIPFAVGVDALFAILALVLPGVLFIERWPVAGGFLVLLGCVCLAALFWWLPNAIVVIALGMVACIASSMRLVRLRRLGERGSAEHERTGD